MRKLAVLAVAFALGCAPAFANVTDALKSGTDKASERVQRPPKNGADAGAYQVAETHIDVTRGNAMTTKRGLFGEPLPVVTSASGIDYAAPGSSLAKAMDNGLRGAIFGAKFGPRLCPDGQPVGILYSPHNFSNYDCSADRPQP